MESYGELQMFMNFVMTYLKSLYNIVMFLYDCLRVNSVHQDDHLPCYLSPSLHGPEVDITLTG